jgi:hypothetical protein
MCYHPEMKKAFGLEKKEDLMIGYLFVGRVEHDQFPEGKRQSPIIEKVRWA